MSERTARQAWWRRRRLLALAGLGAGFGLARRAERAEGANGDNVVAGQAVTATSPTTVQGTVTGNPALRVTNGFPGATDATADGVQGYAAGANNAGLFGRNNDLNGVGVSGAAPNGVGVFGDSLGGTGVAGKSTSGSGVRGDGTNGVGVWGQSSQGVAVYGYASSSDDIGVWGDSLYIGVRGWGPNVGVWGESSPPGHAGWFQGNLRVTGTLTVQGTKSAAVKHPDGQLRRLYCLESPESYFEDVGEGTLTGGVASVKLDPEFAALVQADKYQVFLTEYGAHNDLFVDKRTPTGFEVRAKGAVAGPGTFGYRVIAKRKDVAGPRLEKVSADEPKVKHDPNPGRGQPR